MMIMSVVVAVHGKQKENEVVIEFRYITANKRVFPIIGYRKKGISQYNA